MSATAVLWERLSSNLPKQSAKSTLRRLRRIARGNFPPLPRQRGSGRGRAHGGTARLAFVVGNEYLNVRELHDGLEERFHTVGGLRFLYRPLPGGAVAPGYRLAGLRAPAGTRNPSFGSAQ